MGSGMRSYVVTLDDPLEVVHQICHIVNEFHTKGNRITKLEYHWEDVELRASIQARLRVYWENITPPEHIIDGWDGN